MDIKTIIKPILAAQTPKANNGTKQTLTLCTLGNFTVLFLLSADFFQNYLFSKNYF